MVLVMVGAYQLLSSADLARLTFLTPQTINVIIRNLEERGAILRCPHAVHGRILNVELTRAGAQLLGQCRRRADQIEAHLAAGLKTAAEREVVRRWLSYIAMSLAAERAPYRSALPSPESRRDQEDPSQKWSFGFCCGDGICPLPWRLVARWLGRLFAGSTCGQLGADFLGSCSIRSALADGHPCPRSTGDGCPRGRLHRSGLNDQAS
jgi:DNA-binding MarR family transcriptional regulator